MYSISLSDMRTQAGWSLNLTSEDFRLCSVLVRKYSCTSLYTFTACVADCVCFFVNLKLFPVIYTF